MSKPLPAEKHKKPHEHDSFDAFSVKLTGSNLIEASAGTGKTYSMAILALRLILQEGVAVDKILMVTFTRDATAEMKLRVRQFIREALQTARVTAGGGGSLDGLDEKIVEMVKGFKNTGLAIERLQDALLQFDKAAIFTIHGFCARILGEHAFESGSLFQMKTLQPADFNQYVEDAFNRAWREEVTMLEEDVLMVFYEWGFRRDLVFSLVQNAVGGKTIYLKGRRSGESKGDLLKRTIQELMQSANPDIKIESLYEEKANLERSILEEMVANRTTWVTQAFQHKSKNVQKMIPVLFDNSDEAAFVLLKEKKGTAAFKIFFPASFLEKFDRLEDVLKNINVAEIKIREIRTLPQKLVPQLMNIIGSVIYEKIQSTLSQIKDTQGEATFDDLITGLHNVVCNEGQTNPLAKGRLVKALQKRYTAVFIDEFQDTDQQQFDIFHTLYGNSKNHVLFYIGDPKQSIYGFRKADLETYFKAATLVDHVWRMNTNFRSTPGYVEAMNDFFLPTKDDVFLSKQMKYHKLNTPDKAKTGCLEYDNAPLNPMRIICCGTKNHALHNTILLVRNLLGNPSFKIKMKDNPSAPIQPGQIGILVRNNSEGQAIRDILSHLGIAAVTVSDTKIFETSEAKEIYYILKAAHQVKTGVIHRALLTKVSGLYFGGLTTLHEDKLIQKFREYQEEWKSKGIYPMLRLYFRDSNLINRKQNRTLNNADRVLANIFQLMEMLHEAEIDHKFNPDELIAWLKKGIDGERFSEDEYLQRIESDEAAVKIVTIHSSKGLEYDIVIAPYLDMTPINYFDTTQFRGHDNYYIAEKDSLDKDDALEAKRQTEKENLRLLYVAITRARYHCYVMKTAAVKPGKNNTTTLTKIKDQIINHGKDSKTIRFLGDENAKDEYKNSGLFELNPPELLLMRRVTRQPQDPLLSFAKIPEIKIPDERWQKTSYSRLNIKQDPLLKVHEEVGVDKYDEFIFKKLRKGAQTGNFLHDLLERLDFTKKDYWEYAIKSSLNRYGGTGVTPDYFDMVKIMLEQVTETTLRQESGFDLSLNTVEYAQRLNELEFDLPLSEIDWNLVPQNFEDGKIPIRIRRETPISGGILNGKVDLFFEKEGRFYILDWKSNHLGNRAEDYHENAMAEAMAENNYHLQYYLYSLALLRYLQTRMPGFDYEKQFGGVYYLFIRGVRKGKETGIYFHKPLEKDLILLENALLKPVAVKI